MIAINRPILQYVQIISFILDVIFSFIFLNCDLYLKCIDKQEKIVKSFLLFVFLMFCFVCSIFFFLLEKPHILDEF